MDKILIDPLDFDLEPDTNADSALKFKQLFNYVSTLKTPCLLKLKGGVYHIAPENCEKVKENITNTASKKEIKKQTHVYALYLKNINDVEIDGCGAKIILDSLATAICISSCNNVTIKNLSVDYKTPSDMFATVIQSKPFSALLSVPEDCPYKIKNGKLIYLGAGLKRTVSRRNKDDSILVFTNERTQRTTKTPFDFKLKIKEIKKGLIKVYRLPFNRPQTEQTYAFGTSIRREVGVFINKSKNVNFISFTQNYNHSHGVVAQCSENLYFDKLSFTPSPGRRLASHTDCLHFNSCRGKISVTDSVFCGANDDCINVHGIFFVIRSVNKNKVVCSFMHDQTFGFDPFLIKDTVWFISRDNLLQKGQATVIASRLINDYDVELTLDRDVTDTAASGMGLQIANANPDLDFISNDISFITTRAVLCTTSGKVKIENNVFNMPSMAGIYISDDCNNWYESGYVNDVTIRENTFNKCLGDAILIKPENTVYRGPVHKNIKISNNDFILLNDACCVNACCVDNLDVCSNNIKTERPYPFIFNNCTNVKEENNIY